MYRKIAAGLIACLMTLTMVGCSSDFSNIDSNSVTDVMTDNVNQSSGLGHGASSDINAIEPSEEEQTGGTSITDETDTIAERLIYTATIQMETTNFDKTISSIDTLVTDSGGFIETSSVNGDTEYNDDGTAYIINRTASYTIRIPAEQFQQVLSDVNQFGSIISSEQKATNVASQFTDNEARLDALKTQEESLLHIMEQTTDVNALIQLQDSIADVRYEIEYIERTLRDLQSAVSYSTINLTIQETGDYITVVEHEQTFGQRLKTGLQSGWSTAITVLQDFAVSILSASPVVVLGIIAFLLLYLRWKKHSGPAVKNKESDIHTNETNDKS